MLLLTFQGCAGNLKVSGGVLEGPLSAARPRNSLGANEDRVNAALIPVKPDSWRADAEITATPRPMWRYAAGYSSNLRVFTWQPFVRRVAAAARAGAAGLQAPGDRRQIIRSELLRVLSFWKHRCF